MRAAATIARTRAGTDGVHFISASMTEGLSINCFQLLEKPAMVAPSRTRWSPVQLSDQSPFELIRADIATFSLCPGHRLPTDEYRRT